MRWPVKRRVGPASGRTVSIKQMLWSQHEAANRPPHGSWCVPEQSPRVNNRCSHTPNFPFLKVIVTFISDTSSYYLFIFYHGSNICISLTFLNETPSDATSDINAIFILFPLIFSIISIMPTLINIRAMTIVSGSATKAY